ncbi:MAG: hypothetical protein VB018_12980 [Lachnospiraceae bacterium]|nr:hypothetical protein [Lachnospiraceae bacterium]
MYFILPEAESTYLLTFCSATITESSSSANAILQSSSSLNVFSLSITGTLSIISAVIRSIASG